LNGPINQVFTGVFKIQDKLAQFDQDLSQQLEPLLDIVKHFSLREKVIDNLTSSEKDSS
jgi:hypothetical protein